MVAALLDPLQVKVPVFLGHIIPDFPVLLRKIGGKIQNHRVHIPAVDVLRGVDGDGRQAAADRAVIVPILPCREVAAGAAVAAGRVVADGPPVFVVDAFLEDQLLVHRLLIFFLGQVALLLHLL